MKLSFDPTAGKLQLEFNYNRFLVEGIKELPDRKYDPTNHSWTVGFNSNSLSGILAMLAGNNWPSDQLNSVEAEARAWLASVEPFNDRLASQTAEFEAVIKPTLMKLADLLTQCYLDGKVNQADYGQMMRIINHLSLKDFIHN